MIEEQVNIHALNTTTDAPATTRIKNADLQQTLSDYLARKQKTGTGSLEHNPLNDLPAMLPYGLGIEASAGFLALPTRPDLRRDFTWLIEFQGLGRQGIGMHVLGDV